MITFKKPLIHARIGFSVATGLSGVLSRLICWVTRSKTSHTWLLFYDSFFQKDFVMEAHSTGFRIEPYSVFAKHNKILRVVLPKYPIDLGVLKMVNDLDKNFDYVGLFGMLWVEISAWFHKKVKNPIHTSDSLFCSEAVAKTLKLVNYPGTKDFDPTSIDPGFLWSFFEKDGSQVIEGK